MDCSICLMEVPRIMLVSKCNHRFHKNCLIFWSRVKKECPVCGKIIEVVDTISDDEFKKFSIEAISYKLMAPINPIFGIFHEDVNSCIIGSCIDSK